MVVHLFLNNNKALDFLPINSIKNGGITQPHRMAQLRHRIALCCGIEIQQTKRALVMALQHLAHKRIFIGKQMVKHARAQARLCGQHAHRKLAVAVLRIKLETGGNKLGAGVRHGVRPSEKYWTGVQYTEVWFE